MITNSLSAKQVVVTLITDSLNMVVVTLITDSLNMVVVTLITDSLSVKHGGGDIDHRQSEC